MSMPSWAIINSLNAGISSTSVHSSYFPNEDNPQQTFLRLRQPINEASYPAPRVLKPGYTYRFSFGFVVPARLVPPVCTHEMSNHHVEQSHAMLPPSLGDHPGLAGNETCLDDICPSMCGILYRVCVSVQKKSKSDDNTIPKAVLSASKAVRVIPTVEEDPPMSVSEAGSGYCLSKEKKVKRAFLHNTLGRLVVDAAQPRPIQFSIPDCNSNKPATTAVTLNLRFEPVGDEQPPQLGTIRSGIRVFTFYSTNPWTDYPSPAFEKCLALFGYQVQTKTIAFPTLSIANLQWVKHPTCYTASAIVPIILPKDKIFVPTFHSCWLSRIYSLELGVSYHAPSVNIMTSTASLRIPIQVANERNNSASPQYPTPDDTTDAPPAYSD